MISDGTRGKMTDTLMAELQRAREEKAWRRRARERAAQIGPINAGDPHPRRRLAG